MTGDNIAGPAPPVPPAVFTRDELGRVTMRAIPLDAPITLDGELNESIYQTAAPVTGFIQQNPNEGELATEQSEVWVLFDSEMIYVSARCWTSRPDRIVANEMKRDSSGLFGNDTFGVVFDTFYDRRNGVSFDTNALGALMDGAITDERTFNLDWNTLWDVSTSRFEDGWTVEFAIPFKSLRYRPGPVQIWGINFERRVSWKNEVSFLTPIPAAAGSFMLSSAATLVGLDVPPSDIRLEVKPYAISDVTTDFTSTPALTNQLDGDVGLDVKYGLTEGLTADFTYNTDFAQVEVDEQQVNLTRFSLFYPEKREFFLEGQGIFQFGGEGTNFGSSGSTFQTSAPILFFSRRIGLDDGSEVPILGGGRLTGTTGPYSIGLLNVQTGEASGGRAASTNFSTVRVKRNVLRRSAIGGIFTNRSVATNGGGSNQAYGVDGVFSFYDHLNVNTYIARTETPELRGDDVSYQAQLDYNGDRWGVKIDRLGVGANFNPEIGFVRRTDFRRNFASIRFSPRPESIAAVRKFSWESSLDYITDGTGLPETRIQMGVFGIEFENSDAFFAGVTNTYEFLKQPFVISRDISIPVGGYSFVSSGMAYSLGGQRMISGMLMFERGDFFGGDKTTVGYMMGRVSVTSQLSIEPSLSFNRVTLPQGGFTTELVSARATYTITPRMFVAALSQFNSVSNALSTNIRLRWEYQPGSEVFIVYTDQRDTLAPQFPVLENRAIVIKINRLFRF